MSLRFRSPTPSLTHPTSTHQLQQGGENRTAAGVAAAAGGGGAGADGPGGSGDLQHGRDGDWQADVESCDLECRRGGGVVTITYGTVLLNCKCALITFFALCSY